MCEMRPGKNAHYRTVVLLIFTVVYSLNFLDRKILSILIEPIKADLGLSDTQLGLLTGFLFAFFYTTMGIPIAWLADRLNRVRIVAIACAFWGLSSMSCGLAGSFGQMALARIGVGLGEAGASPATHSVLSDYFPPHKRGTTLAIYSLGVPLGSILASALGASVAAAWGWRTAFFVAGAPGPLMALVVLLIIREPRRGRLERPAEANDPQGLPFLAAVRSFVSRPALLLTAVATGLSAFVGYGMTWIPAFLIRTKGMHLHDVAIYFTIADGLAGVIGTFAGGLIADRLAKRTRRAYQLVPAAGLAIGAPFFAACLFAADWKTSLLLYVVPALVANAFLAPALAFVQNSAEPRERATFSALLLFFLNIVGLGGGPAFVGLVSDMASPYYGNSSLQIGLAALLPFFVLAVAAQFAASIAVRREQGNPELRSQEALA